MGRKSLLIVLMGVSGCGKSALGQALKERLEGVRFEDGDAFHSAANKEKMRQGVALTDEDRRPWLQSIGRRLREAEAEGESLLIGCSALKRSYRDLLRSHVRKLHFLHLSLSEGCAERRLGERSGHFFHPGLLRSQFQVRPELPLQTLEELSGEERRRSAALDAEAPLETLLQEAEGLCKAWM